jgi:hypothetical protein
LIERDRNFSGASASVKVGQARRNPLQTTRFLGSASAGAAGRYHTQDAVTSRQILSQSPKKRAAGADATSRELGLRPPRGWEMQERSEGQGIEASPLGSDRD